MSADALRRLGQHPIAVFAVVTFLISYGLGMPALFAVGAWAPGLGEVANLYLGRVFVVCGPACGAIAAVGAVSGSAAIGPFLRRRLLRPLPWWAVLLPPMMLTLVVIAYAAVGTPIVTLAAAIGGAWPFMLIHFVLQIAIVGIGEELGWRGWLLPALGNRSSTGRAILITGVIWYFWHTPILLGGVRDALWFALAISGMSILLSLLWLRSGGNALLPAIGHGSLNAPVTFFTAILPHADHQAAWHTLAGTVAMFGLTALLCRRGRWPELADGAAVPARQDLSGGRGG